jgi:hypothetical protein
VTLVVYLLGGESEYLDTEDIAIKANELGAGCFSWKKYPDQINIELVRVSLSNAKKQEYGSYIIGSTKTGWQLSQKGLNFCRKRLKDLEEIDISPQLSPEPNAREMVWQSREKSRMLTSPALAIFNSKGIDAVTEQEAEAFFRIDDYVTGTARTRKLSRIMDTFGNDSDLGKAIRALAKKVREK